MALETGVVHLDSPGGLQGTRLALRCGCSPSEPRRAITRAFQTRFWVYKTGSHASLGVSPPCRTDLPDIRQVVAGGTKNCKPRSAKGRVRLYC